MPTEGRREHLGRHRRSALVEGGARRRKGDPGQAPAHHLGLRREGVRARRALHGLGRAGSQGAAGAAESAQPRRGSQDWRPPPEALWQKRHGGGVAGMVRGAGGRGLPGPGAGPARSRLRHPRQGLRRRHLPPGAARAPGAALPRAADRGRPGRPGRWARGEPPVEGFHSKLVVEQLELLWPDAERAAASVQAAEARAEARVPADLAAFRRRALDAMEESCPDPTVQRPELERCLGRMQSDKGLLRKLYWLENKVLELEGCNNQLSRMRAEAQELSKGSADLERKMRSCSTMEERAYGCRVDIWNIADAVRGAMEIEAAEKQIGKGVADFFSGLNPFR
ncbi:unnamed protein product [Prorocentrum cordatum]|uniref:Uncharacterized protein n=1 Tax=Prorocentrum cordatum TaxID=2364126 RepID=A0ABN9UBG4_9DINO|nr:unnamed protein product [Polarella glacialis]